MKADIDWDEWWETKHRIDRLERRTDSGGCGTVMAVYLLAVAAVTAIVLLLGTIERLEHAHGFENHVWECWDVSWVECP